jgi:predicted metal-dependent hydrolase
MADRGGRPVVANTAGRLPARAGRQTVIDADGRAKAYRPMPAPERTAAVIAGLEAYASGDFFEAHELMEPAWMGTDDPFERDLISGLIKVAAADVHGVRGNPRGVARNLEGARDRLRRVPDGDAVPHLRLDLGGLLDAIDQRLAALAVDRPTDPIPLSWSRR